MKELDELKDIFLASDVDAEDYQDNLDKITEWENALTSSEAFASWQTHDVTLQVMEKARSAYKDFAIQLATNRTLTEAQRMRLWALQDASMWMLSLIAQDVSSEITQIHSEIRTAINAT